MTFPTIPTGGRVLTGTQANTTATRTFPDLSGLTKNSGDLLIAIVVAYQSSATAGAVWSGWTSGWTEFLDAGGGSNTAIGAAYKWSDGTETGTISVTEAATVTGHAVFILLSIPRAHASTPPTGGAIANGTASAADPGALNPADWDAEDTLWIAVGAGGETSTTGSFTGVSTTPPANYTNAVQTSISADAVGGVNAAVAFRQLNASSEDVGTWTVDTSNARNSALLIAVRPASTYTSSALEVSSFGTFTGVSSGDTINSVTVGVVHKESATANAPTYELWDGTTARIGSTQTGTASTTDHTNTAVFTGVTYAQLSTLRVRYIASGQSGSTHSLDAISLTVNYTAVSGDKTGTASSSGTASITSTAVVARSATATRSGTAAVTVTGQTNLLSTSSRAGTGAITPAGQVSLSASASCPGTAAVTADGQVNLSASASLSGTGAISSTMSLVAGAATSLVGTAAAIAMGVVATFSPASLPGNDSIGATGQVSVSASSPPLSGVASITAAGQLGVSTSSLPLSGVGTISAAGSVDTTPVTYTSSVLELSTFGTFTGVASGDTINNVTVGVTHKESATASAPTYELWNGASSRIGATATGTVSTTDHTDTTVFTGVTYSQLSTLRVRYIAHGLTSSTHSLDAVTLTVNYTAAPSGDLTRTASRVGTASITSTWRVGLFGSATVAGVGLITALPYMSGVSASASVPGVASITAVGNVATLTSTEHTIFGASTEPGITPAAFSDGTPNIITADGFYRVGAQTAGWRVVGGRIWVPAGSALIGDTATIGLWSTPYASIPNLGTGSPLRSAVTSALVAGWNSTHFATPYSPDVAANEVVWISTRFTTNVASYVAAATADTGSVQAGDGSFIYRAEGAGATRPVFSVNGGTTTVGNGTYSQDIVFDEGAPVTDFTASATRSGSGAITATGVMYTGAATTLTGSGSFTATGMVNKVASATRTGTAAITASGEIAGFTKSAALSIDGAITASATLEARASASRTGTGSITAAGLVATRATSTLSGSWTATTTGVRALYASASITGVGAITPTGAPGGTSAALTGTATITTTSLFSCSGGSTRSGTGSISAAGIKGLFGASTLTGTGSFATMGTLNAASSFSGTATLVGTGSITSAHVPRNVRVLRVYLHPSKAYTITGGPRTVIFITEPRTVTNTTRLQITTVVPSRTVTSDVDHT